MIAILGDLHFFQKNHSKQIFELQMKFFEEQFFPYLLDKKIKYVIQLGDTVHNRNVVDISLLQELKLRFFKWFEENEVYFITLLGNHDIYYKNTLDVNFFAENINEYKYVVCHGKNDTMTLDGYKIGFMPWIVDYNNASFIEDVDICCGHFDIKSFPMLKNVESDEGLNIEQFKKYKIVLSGHYHIKSQKENIYYVGTPYQVTWHDYDIEKGFYVLDKNFKLKFIENKVTPKLFKIYYNELDNNVIQIQIGGLISEKLKTVNIDDVLNIVKNSFIKIYKKSVLDYTKFDAFCNSLLMQYFSNQNIEIIDLNEIIDNHDYATIEDMVNGEGDTIDSMKQYIKAMKFDKSVNTKLLLSIIDQLYIKAHEQIIDMKTE